MECSIQCSTASSGTATSRASGAPLRRAGSASTITSRHGARRSSRSSVSSGRWSMRRCATSGPRSRFWRGQRSRRCRPMAEPAAEAGSSDSLEGQIEQWRSYLRRRQAIRPVDVEELEDHLRGEVAALRGAGLSENEAFLVAVKRMGALDAISNEFAREHSERLWKQLVVSSTGTAESADPARTETVVVFALAVAAALAIKLPQLFGVDWGGAESDQRFYARNFSLFVLPLLTGYFVWKRQLPRRTWMWLAGGFAAAALFANVYPFEAGADTEMLAALHLPIALWLLVGIAYAGGRWQQTAGRMDFVRFSGELLIYYALIALGGGVLLGLTAGMFGAIGIDFEPVFEDWLPCGVLGAVIVASWLVEAKQSVIENMAPVLTRLFTPLFALALLAFLGTMVFTGREIGRASCRER